MADVTISASTPLPHYGKTTITSTASTFTLSSLVSAVWVRVVHDDGATDGSTAPIDGNVWHNIWTRPAGGANINKEFELTAVAGTPDLFYRVY